MLICREISASLPLGRVSGSLDYEEFARAVELSVIDRCADVCNHLALTTSIDLIAAQGCAAAIRKLKIS